MSWLGGNFVPGLCGHGPAGSPTLISNIQHLSRVAGRKSGPQLAVAFFLRFKDSHYVKRCKKNIEEPKHTKTILVCRNKVRQRFIWDLLRADAELTELTQGDGISWQFSGNKFVSYLRFSAILCDPLRLRYLAQAISSVGWPPWHANVRTHHGLPLQRPTWTSTAQSDTTWTAMMLEVLSNQT